MLTVCFAAIALAADITGNWAGSISVGDNQYNLIYSFKQDGEKLTGHYSGQLGEAELTGSVKGSVITFTFTGDAAGTAIEATYSGTVENKDSMKGKVTLGGFGEGTFTGKRQ